MSARLLNGKEPADALLQTLQPLVKKLDPKLVILQVGENAESDTYIRAKMAACERIGMRAEHRKLSSTLSRDEIIAIIADLNRDKDVTGYILQLPLPEALWPDFPLITRAMDPAKDVDGFTAYNLGKVFLSKEFEHLAPATPAGIILLLEHYHIDLEGKTAVIVGQSNLVGKPLSVMLKNRGATTINCDVHTPATTLATLCKNHGDLLISAVGKPNLITGTMIKPGSTVIDVGITRTEDGLKGDIDFDAAKEIASAITPVPGGVGPMTVASLLKNVVTAAQRQPPRSRGSQCGEPAEP